MNGSDKEDCGNFEVPPEAVKGIKSGPSRRRVKYTMLHLPSALVGSLTAGGGFLLIHRELSHRNRLSNKWLLREYAEAQWKDFRSDRRIEDSKVSSEWVQAGLLARPPD